MIYQKHGKNKRLTNFSVFFFTASRTNGTGATSPLLLISLAQTLAMNEKHQLASIESQPLC